MSRFFSEKYKDLVAYVPGEQPRDQKYIKLNTNENPYPPSPAVEKALREMDLARLRKYPDPAAEELTEAIAEYYGITKDRVFPGVGSDDVIGMAFLTFFNGPKPVLFPNITYSFYDVWADLFKIPYETPALNENFEVVPEDYFRENGGIVLANPNAPTGKLLSLRCLYRTAGKNRAGTVYESECR